MSNAVAMNIKPEAWISPQSQFHNEGKFNVKIGNMLYTPTRLPTSAYTETGGLCTFQAVPPSLDTAVSRNILTRYRFRCVMTAVCVQDFTSTVQIGQTDAPRFMPIAQCTTNIQVNLNNTNVTLNTNIMINPLMRLNMSNQLTSFDLSMTPSAMDEYQNYSDFIPSLAPDGLEGVGANPLGSFGHTNGKYSAPRGSWVIDKFLQTPLTSALYEDDVQTTTIEFTVTEPLIVSPFDAVADDSPLVGLSNITITQNIDLSTNRVWSRMQDEQTNAAYKNGFLTSMVTKIIDKPELLITYMTPNTALTVPPVVVQNYSNVDTYQNDVIVTGAPLTRDGTGVLVETKNSFTTANMPLTSIPNRVIVWVEPKIQNKSLFTSDTFCHITKASITYDNQSGILSAATENDLYMMSYKNGYNVSYTEWRRTVGSVLVLDTCKNFCLTKSDEAPGLTCNKQLQITLEFGIINKRGDNSGTWTSIANGAKYSLTEFTCFVAVISTGIMSIERGTAIVQPAILTRTDILNAVESPSKFIMQPSRNFFGGSAATVFKYADKVCKSINNNKRHKGVGRALVGGSFSGGAMISKNELGKRAKQGDRYDNDNDNDDEFYY